jgi:hypothetical protein
MTSIHLDDILRFSTREPIFCFGGGGRGAQCCDVAKVAMTHKNRFSQIWLQAKYESKIFKTSF